MILFYSLFVLLVGCGLEAKTLSEFYEDDIEKVDKIVIFDGSTGYRKTLENQDDVKDFLERIKDIDFIPEENQEDRSGFRYSITFYENGKQTFSCTLNQIGKHYYYTEPDMFGIVDEFYKTIPIQEE
ncbi:hypothetical protein ACLM5H_22180 [Fredinandcohnia humi]